MKGTQRGLASQGVKVIKVSVSNGPFFTEGKAPMNGSLIVGSVKNKTEK